MKRGMDCQAFITGRAITPIGPIIKYRDMSWVTRHGVMTHDRSHVISMSLTAQHSPLSDVSGLSSWHLRERQPCTVTIDGAGSDWDSDYIPSPMAASPVTGSLELLVVAKLSLLSFVFFAGAWAISPPYTHSANFLQILRIQPITPLTIPLMDFNFSSQSEFHSALSLMLTLNDAQQFDSGRGENGFASLFSALQF